jgi:predicted ArsR family transcriptional regulator
MAALTPAHDAVFALLDWLPEDVKADAEVVADLLGIPEAAAARLLDELEAAGDIASATGPLQ